MSTSSEDLNDKLKQSNGGKRSPKRTDEHDKWLVEALGAAMGGAPSTETSASPDGSQARNKSEVIAAFEKLRPQIASASEVVGSKPFFGKFKTLVEKQNGLQGAVKAFESQVEAADEQTSAELLKKVQDLLAPIPALHTEAKAKLALFEEYGVIGDRRIKALVKPAVVPTWLEAAQTEISAAHTRAMNRWSNASIAEQRQDVDECMSKLSAAEAALEKVKAVVLSYEPLRPQLTRLLADLKKGDAGLQALKADLKKVAEAYENGIEKASLTQAQGLSNAVTQKLRETMLADLAGGGAKPGAMRKKLIGDSGDAAGQKAVLSLLSETPQGRKALDDMVADLGGQAKDAASKNFVRAAITARFGPELGDQDLTTKYLPKLYKALGKVPETHTLGNEMLKSINRKRTNVEISGEYFDSGKERGTINLKMPRTGLTVSLESFAATVLPEKLIGKVVAGLGVSQFDVLTLHEVGHSVDDKKQFMNGKVGNVAFGGWQTHTLEEVVAALGDMKGFYKDFAKLGQPSFLKAYLTAVLEKRKPQEDTSVTGELQNGKLKNGATPDWKALARHPAVDCAEHIRMKGDSNGLWDGGDSAAAKHAIGGSVYQQAYSDQWVSYALSARSAKVSDYQFRAEGEWYAEAYAAFFVGKLKDSHPLHALLQADKTAGTAAKRAAR